MLVNIVVNKISLEVVKYSFFYSERTFFDMGYIKCICVVLPRYLTSSSNLTWTSVHYNSIKKYFLVFFFKFNNETEHFE